LESKKDKPSMTFMADRVKAPLASGKATTILNPPHCPACAEKMRLARIEPTRSARALHQADQITYECSCGLILAQTVETPT
jgi:hypothetical protein